MHELKRGIANWERSGQGDGGYLEEEDKEEDVEGVKKTPLFLGPSPIAHRELLTPAKVFFSRKESYLLYLWEVLEWHGLLISLMQRLNTFVISTNGADGIPSIINYQLF